MKPEQPDTKTDVVVVLTGGSDRIETGLDLWATDSAPNLFITGVHKDVTKNEILNMWKGKGSLPECCITLGYKAFTTTQNAEEIQEWLEGKNFSSIRIVTSNYHMHRAFLEFSHALPGIKIITHPIEQPDITPDDEYFWHVIFSEYHKSIFRMITILFDKPALLTGER